MLAFVVVPLVDIRPFWSPGSARQLRVPDFEQVEDGYFLRGFGPLRKRRRGGSPEWSNEEFFYGASGFIRFPPDVMSSRLQVRARIKYIQARFYFDGHST